MEVGIRELKSRLSHYVDCVRQGDTVVITDRGRPVARIEPILVERRTAAIERLLEARLLNAKGPMRDLADPISMLPGAKTSTDYVREQRR